MTVPPPGRFWTTRLWPVLRAASWPTSRASTSAEPPGGNGTTIFIPLPDWAAAGPRVNSRAVRAAAARRRIDIMDPSIRVRAGFPHRMGVHPRRAHGRDAEQQEQPDPIEDHLRMTVVEQQAERRRGRGAADVEATGDEREHLADVAVRRHVAGEDVARGAGDPLPPARRPERPETDHRGEPDGRGASRQHPPA